MSAAKPERARRKRRLALLAVVGLAVTVVPFAAAQQPPGNFECKRGFGEDVVGIGAREQTIVHYRIFLNGFYAPARRNPDGTLADRRGGCREDAPGLVTFEGATADEVVAMMVFHKNVPTDSLDRPYVFYGLERALTSEEKANVEQRSLLNLSGTIGAEGDRILHLPLWIDALGVAYNLDCETGNPGGELRLRGSTLGLVFMGRITRWNDPTLVRDNLGLADCDREVRVGVRADESPKTRLFKEYLSKSNPAWRSYMEAKTTEVQTSTNRKWPPTLLGPCRGRDDGGVGTCVAGQPNAIGYVNLPEARLQGLRLAAVENGAGRFVRPSARACTEAAASIPSYPPAQGDWSQISLTNLPRGYAICGIQFGFVFQEQAQAYGRSYTSVAHIRTLRDYFTWTALETSQNRLRTLGLARLPDALRQVTLDGADSIGR